MLADILMEMSSTKEIGNLKEMLNGEFKMKDPDETKRIIWMYIVRKQKKRVIFSYLNLIS